MCGIVFVVQSPPPLGHSRFFMFFFRVGEDKNDLPSHLLSSTFPNFYSFLGSVFPFHE